jgi:hypothetical protein
MEQILNAKDGYSLALAMLFVMLGAIGWSANKALTIKTEQDRKDAENAARFDAMTCKHTEMIVQIHNEHNIRMERLVEAHRTGTDAMLAKLCETMNNLEKAIEKRTVKFTE